MGRGGQRNNNRPPASPRRHRKRETGVTDRQGWKQWVIGTIAPSLAAKMGDAVAEAIRPGVVALVRLLAGVITGAATVAASKLAGLLDWLGWLPG